MIISAFLIGVATTFFTNFALRMNMTFYDYINKLRIERAVIPLMREHPEYKYEYIASESGFSSDSSPINWNLIIWSRSASNRVL